MDSSQLVYKKSIDSAYDIDKKERILVPYFTYSNKRIVISPKFSGFQKGHKVSEKSKKNLDRKKLNGVISSASSKKIENQLTTWLSSIQAYNSKPVTGNTRKLHYPVFVTLTLSSHQIHDDNFIKRHLLGNFILRIKKDYGVKYYFWRAESQKNGNIHFHLLIDKYIDFNSLRELWNQTQSNYDYINNFEKVHHHRDPNSVDVRSAKNVNNFIEYSLKYMVKEEQYRKIKGRLWGMSDELRNLRVYSDVIDNQVFMALNKALENHEVQVFADEYFTIIDFTPAFYQTELYLILSTRVRKFYLKTYQELYLSVQVEFKPELPPSITEKRYENQTEMHFNLSL